MTYKLFLDDVRDPIFLAERGYVCPAAGVWVIARSYYEAISAVRNFGVPDFVAFDHDLEDAHYDGAEGHERTGYEFAKWLTDYIDSNNTELSDNFDWVVHSMNSVGAANIRNWMNNWFRQYLNERNS